MKKRHEVGIVSQSITGALDIKIPIHKPSTNLQTENKNSLVKNAEIKLIM